LKVLSNENFSIEAFSRFDAIEILVPKSPYYFFYYRLERII